MKTKKLFRGISDKELKEYLELGVPKDKKFTTDIFIAKKYGKNIISVDFSDKTFEPIEKANFTFRQLKIKEKHFRTKKPIKRFKKLLMI